MHAPIEDYALIGDLHTAALVSRDGSIDWLCLPRFDGAAVFAALLGTPEHGRWRIGPAGGGARVVRAYRGDTMVLGTRFETAEGEAELIDFMPVPATEGQVVVARVVRGLRGAVPMEFDLAMRFDYGRTVPWVRRTDYGINAVAGPHAVDVRSPVQLEGEDFHTLARFVVREGDEVAFTLTSHPSHRPPPDPIDALAALDETQRWWERWMGAHEVTDEWQGLVRRSLLTLKALTYAPTGGMVAAPTTSLPTFIGGARNWDYRYCWLRDATFTLYTLLITGFREEAQRWEEWLLRAVAGRPDQLHVMFGIGGERLLPEVELDWLPGYMESRPVRVGNAASTQLQLDVFGEVMDVFHVARRYGLTLDGDSWRMQRAMLTTLEQVWREADEGIWEIRGPRRHFTHSRVMSWVAFDRAVKAVERSGLDGPVDRWRQIRDEIHREVCERAYHATKGAFTQHYETDELDSSVLVIPLVGFLPATDPRMVSTIEAIQRELTDDGFVHRYRTASGVDGLEGEEGAFVLCTYWLADALILAGRRAEGRALFEKVAAIANDVGLLSEEYDPKARRLLGNYPQAFSHIGLVNTAENLLLDKGPAHHRSVP
jgi:GH15 family glucan-1,4-alpha-glucosidase